MSFQRQYLLDSDLDFTIREEDIVETIKNFKDSNTTGPDGLSAIFIKNCLSSITKPNNTCLYNQSLITGIMPSLWKKIIFTPVFKAGNRSDVQNYRPIVILGTVSKIFDSIAAKHLTDTCILLIVKNQHGFVKGRSTLTNLIFYSKFISETLNGHKCKPEVVKQVDSVYLDFAKAFDSVNHNLHIYKLSKFGLCKGTLRWILSYLSNR